MITYVSATAKYVDLGSSDPQDGYYASVPAFELKIPSEIGEHNANAFLEQLNKAIFSKDCLSECKEIRVNAIYLKMRKERSISFDTKKSKKDEYPEVFSFLLSASLTEYTKPGEEAGAKKILSKLLRETILKLLPAKNSLSEKTSLIEKMLAKGGTATPPYSKEEVQKKIEESLNYNENTPISKLREYALGEMYKE